MADSNNAKRDGNHVTSMLFVGSDGLTYNAEGDENTGRLKVDNAGGGAGTVTDVSVVSANGFAGSVANSTTTPAITLSTTVTGITKGNGTALSAAAAGTDYTNEAFKTISVSGQSDVVADGPADTLTLAAGSNITITTNATTDTVTIAASGGGTPGGSDTQVQYNNAGAFGGITGATTDGSSITLVAPVLGTPASGTLTNCSGLPVSSGISGLGAGVATFLATPSSANLASAVTDETGSGALVFASSPTLVTPALGTPASGVLTNCTGLPTTGLVDDAVTLAKMAPGTDGNLITYDANGDPAYVATGASGQVLTSNGAGAAPTFQDAGSGGATCLTLIPQPNIYPNSTPISTLQANSNTTMYVGQMYIPFAITVNKISINVTTAGTAGTLDLSVYSESGASRPIAVTTASISGGGVVTTAVSGVTLTPGVYYMAVNTNSTADVSMKSWTVSDVTGFEGGVTGEPILMGTLTITAGTPPATITPTAVTAVSNSLVAVRLDN